MWAIVRLSFVSAVWLPVKSMLNTVAEKVMEVIAVFKTNEAVPNDAGRAPPVLKVGIAGGFSCAFVRFAKRRVSALATPQSGANRTMATRGAMAAENNRKRSRSMTRSFLVPELSSLRMLSQNQ